MHWLIEFSVTCLLLTPAETVTGGAREPVSIDGYRHRVIVSTDIGGTDPDDFQSMVHFLVYADCFDIEGIVSSPYGPGRKEHIFQVIDCYEKDFPLLKAHSPEYPGPDALRALSKQGAIESADHDGFDSPTEGSDWIVQCARRKDPRPLWILVWGGIDDLAQALHDAPDILPKLRVYFIGGPNKKWSVNAYQYIVTRHKRLWIIEANDSYRGWFVGGNQAGEWGNGSFVAAHISDCGALGCYFASLLKGTIKMGDTPSVVYLLRNTPEDPTKPGWGGMFVRAWKRPYKKFNRLTTKQDSMEQFGVLELAIPAGGTPPKPVEASMLIENQSLKGSVDPSGGIRFRFSPKDAKVYPYVIHSNVASLEGKTGAITSFRPPTDAASRPSTDWPNWWTDNPSPEAAEGPYIGVKTVNRWRGEFLRDFARRMARCKNPVSP